jgi:hypothetical protein
VKHYEYLAGSRQNSPDDPIYLSAGMEGTRSTLQEMQKLQELGKVLAQRIIPEFESQADPKLAHDSSTNTLIQRYRKLKETLS